MTEQQKAIHSKLKALEDSNRTLAYYEASIHELELRIGRADKESVKKYKCDIADLKKQKANFERDVKEAKKIIETCTDVRGKQILKLRYISLIRMEDIAYIMGYERTYLYQIYYKALDKIQQTKQQQPI